MSKRRESAADRIWKEKLDLSVSLEEAVILLVAVMAFVGVLIVV